VVIMAFVRKTYPFNPKSVEKLRNVYERHCELLQNTDDKINQAEYNGVLLGIDLVLELDSSIKQFEDDIRKLEGKSKDEKIIIRGSHGSRSKRENLY
jgi:hypothetical protein